MYKKTFLAIIPAREGSKRLPQKNILNLCGKPLIAYSIEAGLKSKYINKVIVSSDSNEILNISKNYGAFTIKRPHIFAKDTSSTYQAVKHTIDNIESYNYIILLQPTSPLRTFKDIDKSIELLIKKNADAIISTCLVDHPIQWTTTLNTNLNLDSFIQSLNSKRSQEQEKHYRLNGAIYIARTDLLLKEKTFFLKNNTYTYIMPKETSIDIDDETDFLLAQVLLNRK
jgi:CMP-N,N'-diacetyllegionaminic acid synthase